LGEGLSLGETEENAALSFAFVFSDTDALSPPLADAGGKTSFTGRGFGCEGTSRLEDVNKLLIKSENRPM
jgi:hypothetical protein